MKKSFTIHDNIKLDRYYQLFETSQCELNEDSLHRKYKRLALKLHPDKGGMKGEFQDLKEGYETLLIMCRIESDHSDDSNMLGNIMQHLSIFRSKYREPIGKIVDLISKKFGNFSLQYLETLDIQTLMRVYTFVEQISVSNHVPGDILSNIEKVLSKKRNRKCILKKTLFSDMMEKNVYKFDYSDETFFAPMWHSEVEFETSDNTEFSVQFLPELPPNVWLDENNNICIFHQLSFDNTLLYKDTIELVVDAYTFQIPCEQIACKKSQTIVLEGKGLWKIDEKEMFNTQERTHIIVFLDLE